jgi:plastocyanin
MFNPMTATIDAGDAVTFVNDDDEAHTATAVDHSFA